MDILLSIIVIAVIWLVWKQPVQVGGFLFHLNVNIESALYGFFSKELQVGEAKIHLKANRFDPEKETIVMLHGYTADFVVWIRFARYFTGKYNVIIPDLLGHGESEFKPEWNYSVKAQAELVEKLVEQLNIQRFHVIGNSMGGFTSAQLALDCPDKIISACYVDPAGVKPVTASVLEELLSTGFNPFLVHDWGEFVRFYPMTMHRSPWLPNIARKYIAHRYTQRLERYEQIFNDFFGHGLLDERLSDITAPSLIMWGEKDQIIHSDNATKWQALIPHAEVKIWENIGHMPMLEIPRVSANYYQEFLENLKAN